MGWALSCSYPGKDRNRRGTANPLQNEISKFKVPKKFFIRELLPLLANGKVDKLALKKEISEMPKD